MSRPAASLQIDPVPSWRPAGAPVRPLWPAAASGTDLALILMAALGLRLALFNGLFGSDDIVYIQRAFDVADGRWTSANYNGALRYGFNLPAGALVWLFGPSVGVVNLWPLMCSLIEVVAVYAVAAELAGRRTAALAAVLLASAPLHVAVASRVHADPVVSAFLTAAFACLLLGLRRRSNGLLVAAGLCLGGVYWVKELVVVTFFALLPLLGYFRQRPGGALRVVAAAVLVFALNCALMAGISGDPFHLIKVVTGAVQRNFVQGGGGEDAAGYYLNYLWVDIRHVGLLGWLALSGGIALLVDGWRTAPPAAPVRRADGPGWGFVVIWLVGLLLVLSVFPVSLSPLRFTMKQSNYLTLVLAPLALLAALGVSRRPARATLAAAVASVALGVLLACLQQADWRAFSANTKALAHAVAAQPAALWIGSRHNADVGSLLVRLAGGSATVLSYRETRDAPIEYRRRAAAASAVLAVIDPQTARWFAGPSPVVAPLACWQLLAELPPSELGFGNRLAGALGSAVSSVPSAAARRLGDSLAALANPQPARVYAVPGRDVGCGTR